MSRESRRSDVAEAVPTQYEIDSDWEAWPRRARDFVLLTAARQLAALGTPLPRLLLRAARKEAAVGLPPGAIVELDQIVVGHDEHGEEILRITGLIASLNGPQYEGQVVSMPIGKDPIWCGEQQAGTELWDALAPWWRQHPLGLGELYAR